MEEAEVNSETEVATHEAEAETPQEEQPTQKVEGRQDRNWRAVTQKLTDYERQLKEKDEMLKQIISLQQPKAVVQEEPEPDPDEYANYSSVKKTARKAVEPLEKEIQELKQQLAYQKQRELQEDLKRTYPDFDDVVNPETIALFEEKKPKLAESLAKETDPHKLAMMTYEYIKALNITAEVPNKRRQKEAEKMIEKNSKTVQSPQAYDKRPMAQVFRMTAAESSKLYEEMMGYASQASAVPPIS